MKFKRIFLISISLLISLVGISFLNDQSISANIMKDGFYTQFPKHMRGNWYNYSPNTGRAHYLITKNKLIDHNKDYRQTSVIIPPNIINYNDISFNMKQYNKFVQKRFPKYKGDILINALPWPYRHINWLAIQNLDSGVATEDFFYASKIGKHWVLSEASGPGIGETNHFYHSKKIAKKLVNKHYKHFKYGF